MTYSYSILTFLLYILISFNSYSGEYLIHFQENCKAKTPIALDPSALQRRALNGQTYPQAFDFPLKAETLNEISSITSSSLLYSRWMHTAYFEQDLSISAYNTLNSHPCVTSIEEISPNQHYGTALLEADPKADIIDQNSLKYAEYQTNRMGISEFHAANFKGEGIKIAVFDAGFPQVNTHPAFQHIRDQNRIHTTYHFLKGNNKVYKGSSHGRMVLSNIAGITETGQAMGLAPNANFMLAVTENSLREYYGELQAWVMAAEWAEAGGADIINSSLGYHVPQEPKSLITLAAEKAASLGVLVINAAGNDGNGWNTIGAPADAEGIITVGATNPKTDAATNFSSSGPIVRPYLKPEVSAPGINLVASRSGYSIAQGTSFASPIVAGFAACAMQATQKELNTADLRMLIMQSGHLSPYYDFTHGYGVPQALAILNKENFKNNTTDTLFEVNIEAQGSQNIAFSILPLVNLTESYPGKRNLFYKVSQAETTLRYGVIQYDLDAEEELSNRYLFKVPKGDKENPLYLVEIFFEGNYYSEEKNLKQ